MKKENEKKETGALWVEVGILEIIIIPTIPSRLLAARLQLHPKEILRQEEPLSQVQPLTRMPSLALLKHTP